MTQNMSFQVNKINPLPRTVSFEDEEMAEYAFPKPKKALPKIKPKPGSARAKQSIKEQQRDKTLRQAQLFHAKKLKAKLPDPEVVKKAEQEIKRNDKMKEAVRATLDQLMPSIVTEVSLKLGGAMYAQENAIKSIVDEYIKVNPVIETKAEVMKEEITNVLVEKLSQEALTLRTEIPKEVLETVEGEKLEALRSDLEKCEQRIDTARQNLGLQATQADRQKEEILGLDDRVNKLVTDLAVGVSNAQVSAEAKSKDYVDQNLTAIKKKFDGLKTKQKSSEKSIEEITKKLETVQVSETSDAQKIAALEASLAEMKGKKCCCTIM